VRVLAAALVGGATLAAAASSAITQAAEVSMPGKLFAPRDLAVLVGTTVTWRNADTATHTVTEDEEEFDSGFVRPGGTFAVSFTEQGTFVYHCSIHRFMQGTVRVFRVVLRGPVEPLPAGRRTRLEGVAPAGTKEVVLERVLPGPRVEVDRAKPGLEGEFSFAVRAAEAEEVPRPDGVCVEPGRARACGATGQHRAPWPWDCNLCPARAHRQPRRAPGVRPREVRLRHGRARAPERLVSGNNPLCLGTQGARPRRRTQPPGLERRFQPPAPRSPWLAR